MIHHSHRATSRAPADDGPEVDAIVVGSGFGGAVAAARLAQAGLTVTVLERGRRWPPGTFPRHDDLGRDWLWDNDRGLFDVRWLDTMACVLGAGWGGGSLVYANVFARPAPDTMGVRWPHRLRRPELDPYYDLAAHMLEVRPLPGEHPRYGVPARTRLVEDLVATMGIAQAAVRPNLAVRFADPDVATSNRHGIPQRGCSYTGECVVGCNQGAKNTLDQNYLAIAERHGATAIVGAEVMRIAPTGEGWRVWHVDPDDGGRLVARTARRIFLAAGAVATTELLLRSRDLDGTLPRLSPALGQGFSGNGDHLALTNVRRAGADLSTGPTITTSTVLDVEEGGRPVWFQVQDGAYPAALHALVETVVPFPRLRAAARRVRRTDRSRTFALLSMGHDSSSGVLELDSGGSALLRWRNRSQRRLYRAEGRVGPALARHLGAPVHGAVLWTLLRRPVTVHPLGGVPAGTDPATSVVDEVGEVHGYPGLHVVDGATLPASTGVNPSATILASAERTLEVVIRRITGRADWRAPEWSDVPGASAPEDAAFAAMADRRRRTAGDGVVFRERMLSARSSGEVLALRLRVEIRGMSVFLADPDHPARVDGLLTVPGHGDVPVHGTLRILPTAGSGAMRYELAASGEPRVLAVGTKRRSRRSPIARLVALTTLRLEVTGLDHPQPLVTTLTIRPVDVVALVLSLRGTGFTRGRRLRAIARFVRFFVVRAALLPGPASR